VRESDHWNPNLTGPGVDDLIIKRVCNEALVEGLKQK
jgi:hypothetical protein